MRYIDFFLDLLLHRPKDFDPMGTVHAEDETHLDAVFPRLADRKVGKPCWGSDPLQLCLEKLKLIHLTIPSHESEFQPSNFLRSRGSRFFIGDYIRKCHASR